MFRRLGLQQKVLQPRAESSNALSSGSTARASARVETEVRIEKHGLFPLGQSEAAADQVERFDVDIIAVHGIGGDAYNTWTHKNGTFWLKDLLKDALPGARVFTFGYPSAAFLSKSVASVHDFAMNLLNDIRDIQDNEPATVRSLSH
jgi:ankyrin repeat domain-containing protein 50